MAIGADILTIVAPKVNPASAKESAASEKERNRPLREARGVSMRIVYAACRANPFDPITSSRTSSVR